MAIQLAERATPDMQQHRGAGLASVKDAERYLGLSRATIYQLMEKGELRYAKIGRSRRIPWSALEQLVEKSMVAAQEAP
jgi:excisionase family DNA binding protein